jgi:hypothetical protein
MPGQAGARPCRLVLNIIGERRTTQNHLAALFERNLKHLVGQITSFAEIVEYQIKEAVLHDKIHPRRSVDADQPRMKSYVRILARRTRLSGRPAEVDTVAGDERPVALDDYLLELPILCSGQSQVVDMGALITPLMCLGRKRRTQVFIDKDPRQSLTP